MGNFAKPCAVFAVSVTNILMLLIYKPWSRNPFIFLSLCSLVFGQEAVLSVLVMQWCTISYPGNYGVDSYQDIPKFYKSNNTCPKPQSKQIWKRPLVMTQWARTSRAWNVLVMIHRSWVQTSGTSLTLRINRQTIKDAIVVRFILLWAHVTAGETNKQTNRQSKTKLSKH